MKYIGIPKIVHYERQRIKPKKNDNDVRLIKWKVMIIYN